MQEVLSLTK